MYKKFTALLFALLISPLFAFAVSSSAQSTHIFSQSDLTALTEPGVVRILHHIKGTLVIKPFKFDLKTLTISADLTASKQTEIPVDAYMSGTGFFITPDGYILTNGHVVSDDFIRLGVGIQALQQVTLVEAIQQNMTDQEVQDFQDRITQLSDAQKTKNGEDLLSFVDFKDASSSVVVLGPTNKSSLVPAALMKEGLPAEIKQVGEGFPLSDKDVALLKVSGDNYPALPLEGGAQAVKTGNKVYTFGYPASADGSTISLDASFTDGTVSARKESENKNFSLIQTSAKISEGSSGSPLLNDQSKVIGIISMQSGSQSLGDNFGFAIPIDIAKALTGKEGIIPKAGDYDQAFRAGLDQLDGRHCKAAIDEFNKAKDAGVSSVIASEIDPYIQKCNDMIASGKSIDGIWDAVRNWFVELGWKTWAVVAGSIIGIIIIVVVVAKLVKRVRKGQGEIDQLENMMMRDHFAKDAAAMDASQTRENPGFTLVNENQEKSMAGVQSTTTTNPPGTPPELLSYIKQMRTAGITNDAIKAELEKAGWDNDVIVQAMSVQ